MPSLPELFSFLLAVIAAPQVVEAQRRKNPNRDRTRSNNNDNSTKSEMLEGDWTLCELRGISLVSTQGGPIPSVNPTVATVDNACAEDITLTIISEDGDDFNRFQSIQTGLDPFACAAFGIDPCPMAQENEWGAFIRQLSVGGVGLTNEFKEPLVFVSNFQEYLNGTGHWVAIPEGNTALTTTRMTLKSKGRHLYTSFESTISRNIVSNFNIAANFQGLWVKNTTDCKKCKNERNNEDDKPEASQSFSSGAPSDAPSSSPSL